jgi:hypothetical protein
VGMWVFVAFLAYRAMSIWLSDRRHRRCHYMYLGIPLHITGKHIAMFA